MEEESYKMIYKSKKSKKDPLKIIGNNFYRQNRNKAKLIINNKKYSLKEYIDNIKGEEIKIKMILNKNISNKSYMFKDCDSLIEFSITNNILEFIDIDEYHYQNNYSNIEYNEIKETLWIEDEPEFCDLYSGIDDIDGISNPFLENNTSSYIKTQSEEISEFSKKSLLEIIELKYNCSNLEYIFYKCSSLKSIINITKWNTNSVTDMSFMFWGCSSLSSLPDISEWNTNNVIDMSYIFGDCSLLSLLPDISKWNTNNVYNMSFLFYNCSSLSSLPDISKWNTNNVFDMSYIFSGCSSLSSLPDISKWNTKNIINMSGIFNRCSSLSSLPNLSNWNTNNARNISFIYSDCSSLSSIPDISNWITYNVINMSGIFSYCISLSLLPDISKWDTKNVIDMSFIICKCSALL